MPTFPRTIRAVELTRTGTADVLAVSEVTLRPPTASEIVVEVEAAGLNRPDILQREGKYPPPPGAGNVLGLEIAGTVIAGGDKVTRWRIGDKVTALVPAGGYASHAIADEGSALPWPAGYDAIRAAALPETFFTVWSNLFERAGLQAGETVLVHGGASGIGTTAIQLAKAFGATVFATAGSPERCRACERLGATRAIDYHTEDFVAAVRQASDGRGVDVILDMVGGSYVNRNYEAAAIGGRIVQIAFLGGAKAEVDFTRLMVKRLVHTGSTLRPREAPFKAAIAAALEQKVWPLLAAGRVAPVIDAVFAFDDVAAAHRRLEEGPIGKVMLKMK